MNGANMNPGIIVNNACNFSDAIISPEESIAVNKLFGNKLKTDVSGNPKLPAAVIPAVITNKPKRLVRSLGLRRYYLLLPSHLQGCTGRKKILELDLAEK